MLSSIAGEPAPTRTAMTPRRREAFEISQAGHEAFVERDGEDNDIVGAKARPTEAKLFVISEAIEIGLGERI